MDGEDINEMELWSKNIIYGAYREYLDEEYNFIEISRLPKKVNSRNLASLLMSTSQTVPKKIEICYKTDDSDLKDQVALIECKTECDAHRIVEKLKASPFAKTWHINLIRDPKFVKPNSIG